MFILVLDVGLIGLFLIGYLARFIPSEVFWPGELVAIGLPYISLAVLAATGFAFFRRSWLTGAVYAVCVFLVLLRFVPIKSWLAGKSDDGPTLTILTFNVPINWGDIERSERRSRLLELVRRENPDLIAFQEVRVRRRAAPHRITGDPQVVALRDCTDYVTTETGDDVQQSVFSRIPMTEQRRFMITPPEAHYATEITRTVITFEGRKAALFNVHLRSHGPRKPWRARDPEPLSRTFWRPYLRQYRDAFLERAWEARRVRNMIDSEELPVILVGDMNSTPHNWVYQHIRESKRLKDAFLVAGRGWGATYHVRKPLVRIDYVMVGPEFEVVRAHVPEVVLSDHRPVTAVLRWKKTK